MSEDIRWAKLMVAADDIEAHLIVGRLAEAGIDFLVEPDRTGYGDYLMAGHNPHAPVVIHVDADRLREAELALEEGSDTVGSDLPAQGFEDAPLAAPSGAGVRWWIAVALLAVIVMGFLLGSAALRDSIGL